MLEKKPQVYWFQNDHDHRNNLALHGMMQLSKQKSIDFFYLSKDRVKDFFSDPALIQYEHRHTSLLVIEQGQQRKKVLLDSEDSFAQFCPLIDDVDFHFIAAYNASIFEGQTFFEPYSWQSREDVQFYQQCATELIRQYGDQFDKIRPFIPIGPNAEPKRKTGKIEQKYHNLQHRLQKALGHTLYWEQKFQDFEQRYRELFLLRNVALQYDVVLSDTLWNGWPEHRYNLHKVLHQLNKQYDIYASLKRHQGDQEPLPKLKLPLMTKAFLQDYEAMLAASRLAVFATGFHWGWRNIMTLALLWGIPVLMDRPVYEPYFDFSTFSIFYNEDTHWGSVAERLAQIDESAWNSIKQHNQQVYDQYLLPHKVAEYILKTALA